MNKKTLSFEEAYARLETILEALNTGEVSLEKSLALYEEADQLINECNAKLSSAEQKVQTLMKNRSGELELSSEGSPQLASFQTQKEPEVFRGNQ